MADVQSLVDEVQGAAKPARDNAQAIAPPTEMPPTAAAFAGQAEDLGALRDAVADAANAGAGLWFSYLFVLLYLIVAVGGVIHRNLLFESAVKLPFLGVDLLLVGVFVLGPALFLIVYAYVLRRPLRHPRMAARLPIVRKRPGMARARRRVSR